MNSFISWVGGKKLLRREIISKFPEKFNRYIEVFGGAAWVLFYEEKEHAPFEVLNDYNSDLINLYRCVKYHCEEVQKELNFVLNSREIFFDFIKQYKAEGLTDIQRAARYFILIKSSFGSDKTSFGCAKRNLIGLKDYLSKVQERLNKVVIENKDFENLIKVYDRSDALVYLDPPYYQAEKYYNGLFSTDDHLRLNKSINDIKGQFILSYNNCDYIKELYKNYNIFEVSRNHNLRSKNTNSDMEYKELIITNY